MVKELANGHSEGDVGLRILQEAKSDIDAPTPVEIQETTFGEDLAENIHARETSYHEGQQVSRLGTDGTPEIWTVAKISKDGDMQLVKGEMIDPEQVKRAKLSAHEVAVGEEAAQLASEFQKHWPRVCEAMLNVQKIALNDVPRAMKNLNAMKADIFERATERLLAAPTASHIAKELALATQEAAVLFTKEQKAGRANARMKTLVETETGITLVHQEHAKTQADEDDEPLEMEAAPDPSPTPAKAPIIREVVPTRRENQVAAETDLGLTGDEEREMISAPPRKKKVSPPVNTGLLSEARSTERRTPVVPVDREQIQTYSPALTQIADHFVPGGMNDFLTMFRELEKKKKIDFSLDDLSAATPRGLRSWWPGNWGKTVNDYIYKIQRANNELLREQQKQEVRMFIKPAAAQRQERLEEDWFE